MEVFACCILLSVVAASNLNASSPSTVPLNDSTLIVPFTNDSLERPDHWPALPYAYHIDSIYTLYIPKYGNLDPLSHEEVVLAALVGIEEQLAAEGSSDDQIFSTILHKDGVFVSFQTPTSPTLPLRRGEAVKAVRTVWKLMGMYTPRNLPSVTLLHGKDVLAHVSIHILLNPGGIPSLPPSLVSNNSELTSNDLVVRNNALLSWPEAPFTLRLEDNLMMTVFEYGLDDFTASKEDVLDGLYRIEAMIRQKETPDDNLPSEYISAGPVTAVFVGVHYPPSPLTFLQAAQAIHSIFYLTEKYGPRCIFRAEIYVVGSRAMLFVLRPKSSILASGNETSSLTLDLPSNDSAPTSPARNETSFLTLDLPASGNKTSFLTQDLPSNDLAPTSPALVARSNTTSSNMNVDPDQSWPSLPFTFNVEDNLDVTVLEYGANFPGSRRSVLMALTTITEIITKQSGNIIRPQKLSYSPLTIAFNRIPGQGQGAPLLRTQATEVLRAIESLMRDIYKPRELPQAEIYVGGEKTMRLSLKLYFATIDTGNTTLELGNAASELRSESANIRAS